MKQPIGFNQDELENLAEGSAEFVAWLEQQDEIDSEPVAVPSKLTTFALAVGLSMMIRLDSIILYGGGCWDFECTST
jgi:hypothetical protein